MKPLIRTILKEYWADEPDKWTLLEKDLRIVMDQLIEKHTPNWGDDKYAVMNAIDQMFEDGFFQKVPQSLWEQDEPKDDQPNTGSVSAASYRNYNADKGEYEEITPTVSAKLFWHVINKIVEDTPEKELENYSNIVHNNHDPYERYHFFEPILKLFGLNDGRMGTNSMFAKIFHTAVTNYEGIKSGEIQSFNDLEIPELKKYEVKMRQTTNEYVEYTWKIPMSAYSADDAEAEVYADEDGEYSWYEWDHVPGFHKEYLDEEIQERDIENVREV
jgi:hypothetical protein